VRASGQANGLTLRDLAIATVVVAVPAVTSLPNTGLTQSTSPATSSVQSVGVVTVTSRLLNVRKSPALSSPTLGQVSAGAQGTIVGASVQKDGYTWVQVQYKNLLGWSVTSGLSKINSAPSKSVVSALKTGDSVTTISGVNVRKGAGLTENVLGIEVRGSLGTIISGPIRQSGYTWWQVRYSNNLTGWTAGTGLRKTL
jgi:uncharacterized protein YgiM (DUF1202 family)